MPRLFVTTVVVAVIATAVVVAFAIVMDDGHLVYLTDDPGIHLSVAHHLVYDGTWGVVPGHFESASSSPGWTLVLAGLTFGLRPLANVLPLVANLAAGIWLIWIFCANQRLVDREDRSWSARAVAVVLAVAVLYVPALALLGMEHLLQCALVLQAFVLLERLQNRALTFRALLPLLVVVAAAGLVRFESAFVAVGFAVAFVAGTVAHLSDAGTLARWTRRASWRAAFLVSAAGALPIVAFGLVNKAFGQGFLPNSIVAKSAVATSSGVTGYVEDPRDLMAALQRDPLVLGATLLAAVILVIAWSGGPRRLAVPAVAYLVTALLHANFADFGWYERYQEYLVVVGAYLAFQLLAAVTPATFRTAAKVSLVVVLVGLSINRIDLTVNAPRASSNTYRQRYQLARFFEREYSGMPVATTELGYASLMHEGPIVDVLGLGSHDVLDIIRGPGMSSERLAALLHDRGARVFGVMDEYPFRPAGWKKVGIWLLDERLVPGPEGRVLEFWAPPGRATTELRGRLREFSPDLPSRVIALDGQTGRPLAPGSAAPN